MTDRRDFLRLLSLTLAAPLPVLRGALDPLRAVPSPVAGLTPLELIGWHRPRLIRPRWNDAELLGEAAQSLGAMTRAAQADGVNVWARSGHRTLGQQRYLWNGKFRGQENVRSPDGTHATLDDELSDAEKVRRILSYTAFPGTSRHHWGTDVDLAQAYEQRCADYLLDQAEHPAGAGEGAAAAPPAELPRDCLPSQQWLEAHAAEYGWCRVYDTPRGGFQPEPWHWSYLPYAVPALARYLDEVTPDLLRDRGIDGDAVVLDDFPAYRTAFLLGVHPSALPPGTTGATSPASAPADGGAAPPEAPAAP